MTTNKPKCRPMPENPTYTESILCCNTPGCPHMSGPSQPLLCDCCEEKMPKMTISHSVKTGPDIFACGHEMRPGDFGIVGQFGCCYDPTKKCPDCLGWRRAPINPKPIGKDAFNKFTYPMNRRPKE